MKTHILILILVVFLTGCSTKIYRSSSFDVTVNDAITGEPIEDVSLNFIYEKGDQGLTSDRDGEISRDAVFERKFHLYPFPIISGGQLLPEQAYFLEHADYNSYILLCSSTTMQGESYIYQIALIDEGRRDMTIECESCEQHLLANRRYMTASQLQDELCEGSSSPVECKNHYTSLSSATVNSIRE